MTPRSASRSCTAGSVVGVVHRRLERRGSRGGDRVGLAVGSVALVGFGVDSGIEVISAFALLWRLCRAGPNASAQEHGDAERKALYLVAATFFLLAAYILYEAISALLSGEGPETSRLALVLSVLSILIMPTLAYFKGRTGERWAAGRLWPTRWRRGCAYPLDCAAGRRPQRGVRLVVGRPPWGTSDAARDWSGRVGDAGGGP